MDVADKAALASKRVSNIIETMTFNVYRYISRCAAQRKQCIQRQMYMSNTIVKMRLLVDMHTSPAATSVGPELT